ncbi:hypothetical protein ACI65C_006625 [Semiaphis heraclei]
MEQIMSDNKDDGAAARSFHKKLCDFEFLITLVTVSKIAQAISSKFNVEPSIPRIVGIQRHRHNYSTNSPDAYYRISLFIPYLDELNSSLVNRFSKHKKTLVSLQNIIPINAVKSKYENIVDAVHFYLTDFENGEAMIEEISKLYEARAPSEKSFSQLLPTECDVVKLFNIKVLYAEENP